MALACDRRRPILLIVSRPQDVASVLLAWKSPTEGRVAAHLEAAWDHDPYSTPESTAPGRANGQEAYDSSRNFFASAASD
jgi:hypothetical protein